LDKLLNFHITIHGRVQGVGYRAFALKTARSLGIVGYVKNEANGTVFIEAEGGQIALQKFIATCKIGPGWGFVERVTYTEYPLKRFSGFNIKY